MSYIGQDPAIKQEANQARVTRTVFTATASQTVFSVLYNIGNVDVFLNGVKQLQDTDFTANNGTSVTFTTGLSAGSLVEVAAYGSFILSEHYTQPQTDILLATKQDSLVSGTNIKTIGGVSLLGAGNIPMSSVNGTSSRVTYTATAGQTTFAATYDVGYVDCYLNGIKLIAGSDFTATTGTSVVLTTGATVGDTVDIVGYGSFELANTYTVAQTDTLLAAKQATLVSGTSIKTVNSTSLLGSGNVAVGTVTTASVVTANGFAGTVATATTTPAITITTSVTGVLKGNGTAISAAVAGTDYLAPPSGTSILKAASGGALTNAVAGTDYVAPSGALGTPSSGALTNCTADGTNAVGFKEIPQNSQSAAYTCVLADSGKHILHPSADTTARTFTIPANSSVAYPIGTAITFVNQNSAGVVTISITTDTMRLAGAGTTGSRTLAANGIATAIKLTSTEWIISGTGLT